VHDTPVVTVLLRNIRYNITSAIKLMINRKASATVLRGHGFGSAVACESIPHYKKTKNKKKRIESKISY
jgi:hypothetical protein